MQLSVIVEFLLSGVLSVTGLAVFLEALRRDMVLGLIRQLMINPQTRLPENVIVTAGTVFLGLCYFVGILTSIAVYDVFLKTKMRNIAKEVLERSHDLTAQVKGIPHFPIYKDDLYDAVTVFIDVNAPEAVKRRRDFEGSLQRLARGSLPGLLLLFLAGLISVWPAVSPWSVDLVQVVVLLTCGALILMAFSLLWHSMRDEAVYLTGAFAILRDSGRSSAPALPTTPRVGT